MNKNKNKNMGLYIKIGENERGLIKKLKEIYCINISELVRRSILDRYNELEKTQHE
jgi:hypothetical protein